MVTVQGTVLKWEKARFHGGIARGFADPRRISANGKAPLSRACG